MDGRDAASTNRHPDGHPDLYPFPNQLPAAPTYRPPPPVLPVYQQQPSSPAHLPPPAPSFGYGRYERDEYEDLQGLRYSSRPYDTQDMNVFELGQWLLTRPMARRSTTTARFRGACRLIRRTKRRRVWFLGTATRLMSRPQFGDTQRRSVRHTKRRRICELRSPGRQSSIPLPPLPAIIVLLRMSIAR
jgi:hypothetical protein